jgi:hypothetical protein
VPTAFSAQCPLIVWHCVCTAGGDPRATDSRVQAEAVKSYLLSEFDLDVDVESAFKLGMTKELSKGDFAGLLNAS